MDRRRLLGGAGAGLVLVGTPACALIFSGAKAPDERDYSRIQWGWLILDVLFLGFVGVLVDFLSGAIYARAAPPDDGLPSWSRRLDPCEEASRRLVAIGRARPAAVWLRGHLHTCPTCAGQLRRLEEAPVVDLTPLLVAEGEVAEEPVLVELAPG